MATAAELTGEEIAAVAESLSDPANLNVDTMAAIMHRIGPGLMALGQKVLVALIIFLIGRKVISMIEKMLSRLDGACRYGCGGDSFPAGADPVCDECLPAFL